MVVKPLTTVHRMSYKLHLEPSFLNLFFFLVNVSWDTRYIQKDAIEDSVPLFLYCCSLPFHSLLANCYVYVCVIFTARAHVPTTNCLPSGCPLYVTRHSFSRNKRPPCLCGGMAFAELKVADSNPGRDDQFPARAERENIRIATFRGKLGKPRWKKLIRSLPLRLYLIAPVLLRDALRPTNQWTESYEMLQFWASSEKAFMACFVF